MRKAIQYLPTGTNAYERLYADTMKRIQDKDTHDIAVLALSWVAWARWPLTLQQVQHALVISEGREALDVDNTTDEEAMLSACKGLVVVGGETKILRLIHYTTREYLESARHNLFPTTEGDILRVCQDLLSSSTFSHSRGQEYESYDDKFTLPIHRDAKFLLYHYAANNWGYHAHNCGAILEERIVGFLQ